uniref:Uncharacterized protein n=1 Tax=Panagrolaimus superbus TaxID=310955 RepID=A0A914YC79_9BILA
MGCCNKRCFAVDLVNQIPDAERRHEFYQQIFKNQQFEEIFKLYKGDIRRAKMPRKDLNSQYSNASKSGTTNNSSISSLYESMESLNESEENTKSSGKYDLPPSQSSGASESEIESVKSFKLEKPHAIEILVCRFVILESSYFSTIKRHRFEEEYQTKVPILAAVEMLMGISAGYVSSFFACGGIVL